MIRTWLADQGFLWGPGTALILFLALFIGVLVWVFRPGSRETYEQEARLPLEGDGPAGTEPISTTEEHHGRGT